MPSLGIEVESTKVAFIVTLHGELDLGSTPALRAAFESIPWTGVPRVVVDLRGLTFMDSSGLAEMVWILTKARASGKGLRLLPADAPVQRIFEVSGLLDSFDWTDDEGG